ncbi:predicted protein [Chaetomium globosum CBS 148.51]|uniref:Uncharacterized protein n=1 Tax=Chaetomium globosum (strain ATCC 6205 / CBS 148.51 / DSM 1962 / NBRC 6347 / NRRL 1970) TaxID=306901 RepID=Q2HH33_CHAGB|nr:uncharacterized protein CHGG_00471 [Chaetomium globosum CBS 148.51]EAQ92236.1 predicted protein [Chaetomium globosum CBS 148.51]
MHKSARQSRGAWSRRRAVGFDGLHGDILDGVMGLMVFHKSMCDDESLGTIGSIVRQNLSAGKDIRLERGQELVLPAVGRRASPG